MAKRDRVVLSRTRLNLVAEQLEVVGLELRSMAEAARQMAGGGVGLTFSLAMRQLEGRLDRQAERLRKPGSDLLGLMLAPTPARAPARAGTKAGRVIVPVSARGGGGSGGKRKK